MGRLTKMGHILTAEVGVVSIGADSAQQYVTHVRNNIGSKTDGRIAGGRTSLGE